MTKERRLGHCYKLAGRKLLYGLQHKDGVLHHGTIQGRDEPPLAHAWVECDGSAWEPILDEWMATVVFYQFFDATSYHRYSREEVAEWTLRTGHWGPWEGDYWKDEQTAEEAEVATS